MTADGDDRMRGPGASADAERQCIGPLGLSQKDRPSAVHEMTQTAG